MKKLLLLFFLLQLSTFAVKAANCGSFTSGKTQCSQTAPGQQTNCCSCIGSEPQNAGFCHGAPINKGLITLIIGGVIIGLYATRKQFNLGQNAGL